MASLRISFEGIKSTGYGKFILLSAITAPPIRRCHGPAFTGH